jgi:FdrA protein
MQKVFIRKDTYYDSIVLMEVSARLKKIEGLTEVVVTMATPQNVQLLANLGFGGEVASTTPNDLVIAVRAESPELVESVPAMVDELLRSSRRAASRPGELGPADIASAAASLPGANLAVISVAGAYAWYEAKKALDAGLHVMLFSDNVPLEREVELKRLAAQRGLLVMGPDCGTAMIGGIPLCFANEVRRGGIGIVGASGTGIQEISVLVDRLGEGITHAIGTGGRDLSEAVGGMTMLQGIAALRRDPATRVIVAVSKPPHPSVEKRVMRALASAGKPAIVHFIASSGADDAAGVMRAASLEGAAVAAVAALRGRDPHVSALSMKDDDLAALVKRETAGKSKEQKYVRGFFTGGTLCDEALFFLSGMVRPLLSNNHPDASMRPEDPFRSRENALVDLGDDVYTSGRPHPMIDPSARAERIERESGDPGIAVMMLDVMLGHGSHPDPAGAVLPAVASAREKAKRRGGDLTVVAEVVGTDRDFQNFSLQKRKLEDQGVIVAPSNLQAARIVLALYEALQART